MKANLKSFNYILIVVLIFFSSCNSGKKNESPNSKLLQKIDSLDKENKKLAEQLSATRQQTIANESQPASIQNNSSVAKGNYAFVVLSVKITEPYFSELLQKKTTKTEDYSICSKVRQFDIFNDDLKYQFMDDIQNEYMKGRMQGGSYSTKIANRQCFAFNTYEEASKEREKYLLTKE
jgi:hypothetical protein